MSNWGQTAAHTHGRQCLCCVQGHLRKPVRARKKAARKGAGGTGSRVPHQRKGAGSGHSRVPVRARKGATRKGAGGTGSRVPHARKGAGPGHSRVPVRARKGALASGALARVPVRARTHQPRATNRLD